MSYLLVPPSYCYNVSFAGRRHVYTKHKTKIASTIMYMRSKGPIKYGLPVPWGLDSACSKNQKRLVFDLF